MNKKVTGKLFILRLYLLFSLMIILGMVLLFIKAPRIRHAERPAINELRWRDYELLWYGPNEQEIPENNKEHIIRGFQLIKNTSKYLGHGGVIASISNGMNCQNCHLEGGRKPWGNNFFAVYSTYPKFRERSGTTESIAYRVNDCLVRSLNGKPLQENSTEMQDIISYITWLGTGVKKGVKPPGTGIMELPLLEVPADPVSGKIIFGKHCSICHGKHGEGLPGSDGKGNSYPPLWGKGSFNTGAGMNRISRLAGFIRYNMPNGTSYLDPKLSVKEAWDVAAFILSQPRPEFDQSGDWPSLVTKPYDYPYGPYADGYPEDQHKFGPFGPIMAKLAELKRGK